MDLPADLLNVLKCCLCEGYLSSGPIYTVETGEATCGRCNSKKIDADNNLPNSANSEVSRTRNIHYEILASVFQFPCRFASFGCPEKLLFFEEPRHPHELSCQFEPYVCPILSNNRCDWRGPLHHLLEHCDQAHPDNILENLYSSEPNFSKNSVTTYIIPCFNTVFVLRINISMSAVRAIYSLYLLDDPSKLRLYRFSVDCKRNGLTLSKPGQIGTIDDFIKQKPIFCIISRQALLSSVGAVAGTTFVINIKQISGTIKCKFCCAEVDNYEAYEWVCNNCESKLQYCQNKHMNCTFKDIHLQKVKKHERYFCKYINKCFDCSGVVTAGKIFHHFDSSAHENTIFSKVGLNWKASETPKRKLNYVLLKSPLIDQMFCKYYLDARQLSIILCTTHSSDQLSLYKCIIEVKEKEAECPQIFEPDVVQYFFWDWRIDIDLDFDQYEPVELDIKICFEKQC